MSASTLIEKDPVWVNGVQYQVATRQVGNTLLVAVTELSPINERSSRRFRIAADIARLAGFDTEFPCRMVNVATDSGRADRTCWAF